MHAFVAGVLLLLAAFFAFVTYLTLAVNAEANHQDTAASMPSVARDLDGFLRAFQGAAGQAASEGNAATLYQNGDAIFPAMLDAIRAARTSVHLATYIYWNGEVPDAFTDALVQAASRGAVVRVALDREGSERIHAATIARLTEAGCRVAWFRRAQWFDWRQYNRRSHRRLLVVDGRVGFTGGAGIADQWAGDGDAPAHWRDTHVRVEGPVVAALQAGFSDTWNLCTHELLVDGRDFPVLPAAGPARAVAVLSTPAGGASAAQRAYAACIAGASRTLHVTNAYFVPTPSFVDALAAARRRGVDVTIVVPGPWHNKAAVRRASRHTWPALLAAGVVVAEFQPTMVHAKTMVVDGMLHLVGSINFDPRSFSLNAESAVLLADAGLAADAERVFADDLAHSRRVTHEEVAARGLATRVIDALCYWLRAQL